MRRALIAALLIPALAFGQAVVPSSGGNSNFSQTLTKRREWKWVPMVNDVSNETNWFNQAIQSFTTIGSGFTVANGNSGTAGDNSVFLKYTTGAVSGNSAGRRGNFGPQSGPAWKMQFHGTVRTYATITSMRVWFGLMNASPDQSDTPTTGGYAFRFSTGASDTTWKFCYADGAAANCSLDTGVTVAINSNYRMSIDCSISVTVCYGFINDAFIGTVPQNTNSFVVGGGISVTTLTAATRDIGYSGFIYSAELD